MNQGKYVFAQIVEFLPQRILNRFVEKYNGNKWVKHFSCWNQLLCMLFGQLTNRDSLRDLIVALDAHSSKSYHLGFGKNVTISNLAKANETRNSKIFEAFAYHLIAIARRKRTNNDITPATMNDMKAMDYLVYEQNAIYIFDRGYVDYTRLYKITVNSAFFVI